MSAPVILPQPTPPPQTPAAALQLVRASLEALSLKLGQVLEATVLGTNAQGLTQLKLGGETLTVKLSLPLPAGTQIQVTVQPAANGRPVLAVLPRAPVPTPVPPAPLPMPAQMQVVMPQVTPGPLPVPTQVAVPTGNGPAAAVPTAAAPVTAAPTTLVGQMPATGPTPLPAPPTLPGPAMSTVAGGTSQPVVTAQVSSAPPRPTVPTSTAMPVQPTTGQSAVTSPATPGPIPAAMPSVAAGQAVAVATPATPPQIAAQQAVTVALPTGSTAPSAPLSSPSAAAPAASIISTQAALVGATPASLAAAATNLAAATQTGTQPAAQAQAPQPTAPQSALPQAATTAVAPALPPASAPTMARPSVMAPAQRVTTSTLSLAQPAQAAARQDSMAPLLQNLSALQVRMGDLPRPVVEAAVRLLAQRIPLNRGAPTGEMIKQAVMRSGVFLTPPSKAGAQSVDVKSALLQLRAGLMGLLGNGEIAAVAPVARRPPPPLRDAQPRAVRGEAPTLSDGASAREVGRTLLHQTDGALSRLRLTQLASQPQDARPGALPSADFMVELPMVLGSELAIAQLQVQRDGKGNKKASERGWRLRFAVSFSVIGEVGAQISLLGSTTNVVIWADEAATADALEAMLPELTPALAVRGLEVGSVRVRRGAPEPANHTAGRLMDEVR